MIRKAETKDIFYISKLEKKVFKQSLGEKFILQELTDNPFSHYFVYVMGSEVVGYIGFRVYDAQAEMMNFAILPDYQDQGLGTELLTYTTEYLEKLNVKTMSLEVRKSNKRAQHIYEKLGFKVSHIRKKYYETEDGYVLIKEVNS
ncbi:MAG: ribosomal protein S18-alanine N-acetyltransferase [Acholeplasmataceae bacterium]|nr:ribosomal protein S18-alanine N-acetyltransferase [Acholeplasmataceae bacterium]